MKTRNPLNPQFCSPVPDPSGRLTVVTLLLLWTWVATAQPEGLGDAPPSTTSESSAVPTAPGEAPETPAPEQAPAARERLSIGSDLTLGADQTASRVVTVFGSSDVAGTVLNEMVTVFGDAKLTGRADREFVTVFGNAEVNGPVARECVVVFGNLSLGPQAKIGKECVVICGKIDRHAEAQLDQEPVCILPVFSGLGEWFREGLLLGRLIPPGSRLAWIVAGLHLLLYALIAWLLPRPVRCCVDQLESRALLSFGVGILTLFLLLPLYLILAAVGVGIALIPLVGLAETLLVCVGRTAVFEFFGFQVLRGFGRKPASAPLPGFLIGFGLVTLLYMVPIVGLLLWMIVRPFSLGAAVLALGAALRRGANGRSSGAPVPPVPEASGWMAAPVTGSPPESASAGAPPPPPEAVPRHTSPASPPPMETAGMPRAGFWIRLVATGLDFIALCWILLLPYVDSFFLFFWIAYHIGMWTWKGTTIGGVVCNLKVVRLDGRQADASVCVVRGLAGIFSALPLLLGFFWAGWSAERQSWHDKIAGTVIVRWPRGLSLV